MRAPGQWLPPPPWEGPPIPRRLLKPDAFVPGRPAPGLAKPGCTAADEAIVALGHLEGLARGNEGFGVLRVSKERLEKAAAAAEGLKHPEIAAAMRAVAAQMPGVHTRAGAQALADELRPVVDQAWDLGRRCKDSSTFAKLMGGLK